MWLIPAERSTHWFFSFVVVLFFLSLCGFVQLVSSCISRVKQQVATSVKTRYWRNAPLAFLSRIVVGGDEGHLADGGRDCFLPDFDLDGRAVLGERCIHVTHGNVLFQAGRGAAAGHLTYAKIEKSDWQKSQRKSLKGLLLLSSHLHIKLLFVYIHSLFFIYGQTLLWKKWHATFILFMMSWKLRNALEN